MLRFARVQPLRGYATASKGIAFANGKPAKKTKPTPETAIAISPPSSNSTTESTSASNSPRIEGKGNEIAPLLFIPSPPKQTSMKSFPVKVDPNHGLYRYFTSVATEEGDLQYETTPVKQPDAALTGRAWEAAELRLKSFKDLHTLWYVLLRERNLLATQTHNLRRLGISPQQAVSGNYSVQARQCRKSMARIKYVMNERRLAFDGAVKIFQNEQIKAKAAKQDELVLAHKLKVYREEKRALEDEILLTKYANRRVQFEGRLLVPPKDASVLTGDEATAALEAEVQAATRKAEEDLKITETMSKTEIHQKRLELRKKRKEILDAARAIKPQLLKGTLISAEEKERRLKEDQKAVRLAKRQKQRQALLKKTDLSAIIARASEHSLRV